MAELKTKPHDGDVEAFLQTVEDEQKHKDCLTVMELMRDVTGCEPKMWGPSIVGFGNYDYQNRSGGGNWFLTGFAPRKQNLTLYIMSGFSKYDELMGSLGKHKTGKSCLYIKKLDDVDMDVLKELVQRSIENLMGQK